MRVSKFSLKLIIKIAVSFLLLVFLFISGLVIYFNANKDKFRKQILEVSNEHLNGELKFSDITLDFWHHFPSIATTIQDVELLNNSISDQSHQTIISAKNIHLAVSISNLFTGNLSFDEISILDANVNIYTNINGVSNLKNLVKSENIEPKKNTDKKSPLGGNLDLAIKNSTLRVIDEAKKKDFNIKLNKVETELKKSGANVFTENELSLDILGLSFNTEKGSFFNGANFSGKFKAEFQSDNNKIEVAPFVAEINNQLFNIEANIGLADGGDYWFDIQNEATNYNETIKLLSENIQQRLKMFQFKNTITAHCTLNGSFKPGSNPLVKVDFNTKGNSFNINEKMRFSAVGFQGSFQNRVLVDSVQNRDQGKDVFVLFDYFKAEYKTVPFELKKSWFEDSEMFGSKAEIQVKSHGDSKSLNTLFGNKDFLFESGEYDFKGNFTGKVSSLTSIFRNLDSELKIKNNNVLFVPNNIRLSVETIHLGIQNNLAELKSFVLKSYETNRTLDMKGSIKNVTGIAFDHELQAETYLQFAAKKIDLEKLLSLMKPPQTKETKKKTSLRIFLSKLYNTFQPTVDVDVDELIYKKIKATDVSLTIGFTNPKHIKLIETSLNYGGGSIRMEADLKLDNAIYTASEIDLKTNKIPLGKFMEDMDYLGVKSLREADKLNGVLDLDTKISAHFANGELIGESLNGRIDFNVSKGEIAGFSPLKKIGDVIKNKHRFDDVRFAPIQNKFTITNGDVTIPQMPIFSNALHCYLEGIYSYVGHTDLWVSVPLANISAKKVNDLKVVPYNQSGSKVFVEIVEQNDKFKYKLKLTNKDLYKKKGILNQYKEDKKEERRVRRAMHQNEQ